MKRHHLDPLVEKMANANAVSERAALNATFKTKPPFSSLMAASITKSIAGLSCKDLARTVWTKIK